MSDFVCRADSQTIMQAAYAALGFWDAANSCPIINGPLPGGVGASYFINEVGVVFEPTGATMADGFGNTVPVMAAIPGYWVRIRINGEDPFTSGSLTIPSTITVYPPGDTQETIRILLGSFTGNLL